MIRHLTPRLQCGSWGGAALTNDGSPTGDDVTGFHLTFQWLGLLIEVGFGSLTRSKGASR